MQNLKAIRETDFSKGYNDRTKPELLPEGYCADALNCWVDNQLIQKRTGYSLAGNTSAVTKPILSLGSVKPGASEYLWRARDDADGDYAIIEYWSGTGNWTTVTDADEQTAGKEHIFITANNAGYIINDTDTVLKSANGTTTSTAASFPKGIDGKWFHNYMFVLTAAGRLYWSNLNDPDTYDVDDYIDINPNDGDIAVGLAVLKDELFIFKKNRVWALTGFGASDFTVADMGERASGMGAQSRQSIIETGNDIYFLDFSGNIPQFRSIQRTRYGAIVAGSIISEAIEGTMDDIAKSQLGNCAGIFDGRKIWWAVTDTGTYNNLVLVYDTLTKGWVRFTGLNASCWTQSSLVSNNKIYFGDGSAHTKTYVLDSSTSDNGTAIDMQFKSRMYNPFPESKCKWKYMYIACDVDSAASLDIDYSRDGFGFNDLDDLTLTGSGSVFPVTFGTSRFGTASIVRERIDSAGGISYKMQYKFSNNTTTDTVNIREYQLLYKPKGLRASNEA